MEAAKFTSAALLELQARPVERREEARYQAQMARHHYLGEFPSIGKITALCEEIARRGG